MSILPILEQNLKRRDEKANILLAQSIASKNDTKAVEELATLVIGKNKPLAADAIKILYEAGELKPALIKPNVDTFLKLLSSKDNRIRWGAMTALSAISKEFAESLINSIPAMLDTSALWTVISRDHFMRILNNIGKTQKGKKVAGPLMIEQLYISPTNQFPRYAEQTAEVVTGTTIAELITIIKSRKDVMEYPAKAKKLQTLVKQLESKLSQS